MNEIRWTPEAAEDFARIVRHIRQDNPEAARRVAREVFRRIQDLGTFPLRGRKGREQGTRELVLSPLPYIVIYRMRREAVQVIRLFHGAQDWNPQ